MIDGGGISSRPMSAPRTTLIEHLVHHGETRAGDLCARYLFNDRAPVELTFGEDLGRTRRYAAGYEAHGVKPGDVVLRAEREPDATGRGLLAGARGEGPGRVRRIAPRARLR